MDRPARRDEPAATPALEATIAEAAAELRALQHDDGRWAFELEADATIPSEYILLEHFLGEIDDAVEGKLAAYLRATQADHGGWPLYAGGDFNVSASVKAYYALKLVGDDPAAPPAPSSCATGYPRASSIRRWRSCAGPAPRCCSAGACAHSNPRAAASAP